MTRGGGERKGIDECDRRYVRLEREQRSVVMLRGGVPIMMGPKGFVKEWSLCGRGGSSSSGKTWGHVIVGRERLGGKGCGVSMRRSSLARRYQGREYEMCRRRS